MFETINFFVNNNWNIKLYFVHAILLYYIITHTKKKKIRAKVFEKLVANLKRQYASVIRLHIKKMPLF